MFVTNYKFPFDDPRECNCSGDSCSECTFQFNPDVKCLDTRNVTIADLIASDPRVVPATMNREDQADDDEKGTLILESILLITLIINIFFLFLETLIAKLSKGQEVKLRAFDKKGFLNLSKWF